MILGIDFETYSAVDIKNGSDAYAAHWSTGVHCGVLVLATEDLELKGSFHWIAGKKLPPWAFEHLKAGRPVLAHNASFERSIIHHVLRPRFEWPTVPLDSWRDSLLVAAANNLPTSLAGLGKALGTPVQKDDDGHALMKALCRVVHDKETGTWLAPVPTDEQLQRLIRYCEMDVLTMLECWKRLPKLSPFENKLLCIDRKINVRGAPLDAKLALNMRDMAIDRVKQLDRDTARITECEILSTSSAPAMKGYLGGEDVELPMQLRVKKGVRTQTASIDKEAVKELLEDDDLPDHIRELLGVRQEAGKATSLAKLARIPDMVSADGRLRHALKYCGAHTGRWSSQGLQIHNMPKSPKEFQAVAEPLREAILKRDLEKALSLAPNLMQAMSWLLRSVIAAPTGKELIGGDYSAIEARVLAWLAGQNDVLELFATGVDVYTADAKAIGSDDRQLGKVQRLALGYGMGAVKFAAKAAEYGIDLSLKDARTVQQLWRKNNPAICQFWLDLEHACHAATRGESTKVGRLNVVADKTCLRIVLPSGRSLRYWRPHLRNSVRMVETVNDAGELIERELSLTELRFYTESPDRKGMMIEGTYGGKLSENVTQAVSRELLGAALVRLDSTAYDVVMHVHDSIVAEVDTGTGDVDEFCKIMARSPKWATDLPIAVDGYRGKHFRG